MTLGGVALLQEEENLEGDDHDQLNDHRDWRDWEDR